jgi:hypothetical protein
MSARLGLILATGPETGDLPRLLALATAARHRGLAVDVFAMHAGVLALAAAPATVAALVDAGCDVVGCATSADRHGVDLAALGVVAGSQDDHAAATDARHHVVAFT